MKKKTVYISGPISATTQEEQAGNVQAFHDCAALLKACGRKAVNPARAWPCRWAWLYRLMERWLGKDGAYRAVLVYDLWLLSRSDAICLIDGWQQSRGARIEANFAALTGIPRSHRYDPRQKKLTKWEKQRRKKRKEE